jgi:hypothetical protein
MNPEKLSPLISTVELHYRGLYITQILLYCYCPRFPKAIHALHEGYLLRSIPTLYNIIIMAGVIVINMAVGWMKNSPYYIATVSEENPQPPAHKTSSYISRISWTENSG